MPGCSPPRSEARIQALLANFLWPLPQCTLNTICFRVCTGCSFCLECPSHAAYLSNSYSPFKTPGQLYLLWEVLPQTPVHPHYSITPTLGFPGCSSNRSFYKYLFSLCLVPGTAQGAEDTRPRLNSVRPGHGSLSPCEPLPGGADREGASEGPQGVMGLQLGI